MLSGSCLYPYVFNTRPPESATVMTRYDTVPHPFTLHLGPPQTGWLSAETPLSVFLTLIGGAGRHAAFFVRALQLAGESGIGARRTRFVLRDVEQLDPTAPRHAMPLDWAKGRFGAPQPIPVKPASSSGEINLDILTPLRLKAAGRLITPETFAPCHLLSSLVRRVAMLMYFHTETQLDVDYRALKEDAARVTMPQSQLRWHEMTRRSSRQESIMQTGGIHGAVRLDLSIAPEFWPYVRLGEIVQAGKGTSMGLGLYSIRQPA